MNSITKRWIRGSLLLTIGLLIVAEGLLSLFTVNDYYNGVRQAIMTRMNTISGQLSVTANLSDEEREEAFEKTVKEFEETDKFELMLIGADGNIIATSSGFEPGPEDTVVDYQQALHAEDGKGEFMGDMGQGERVMAITELLDNPTENAVALRFVTSLSGVDGQIMMVLLLSLFIMGIIILFSVMSGLYFVRSIVNPVGKIEATATRIAAGDFNVRIEENYNDEIGKLGNTINHMAEELGHTEQMKNEFIASVSHELRTPLTSIKGWTETLAKVNDPTSEDYKRGVRIILAETDRLYAMVEELLDFSRMQGGGLSLAYEKLDIIAEVSDAVLMCTQRAALEEKQLIYQEPDFAIPVWGDKNRLRQVFINILDNALKYTPAGGTVAVKLSANSKKVTILFIDKGTGIDKEDLEQVKTKFFKGKGAVRGSGIGLAVANEILIAHGGELELSSKIKEGTTVKVSLPTYADVERNISVEQS